MTTASSSSCSPSDNVHYRRHYRNGSKINSDLVPSTSRDDFKGNKAHHPTTSTRVIKTFCRCLIGCLLALYILNIYVVVPDNSNNPPTEGNKNQAFPSQGIAQSVRHEIENNNQPTIPVKRHRVTLPPRNTSSETAGFVHIGKTGGSTLSSLLRTGCTSFLDNKCARNFTTGEETPISKLVEHYYHVPDFWRLPESNHKLFIVTARDVYDRSVSALLYHHPYNAKFYGLQQNKRQQKMGRDAYQCFPTLEDFAKQIQKSNADNGDCHYPYPHNVIEPKDCAALACAALQGKVRFFTHLFFGFRNILDSKLPNNEHDVFVIRQEHLWEDWNNLNHVLGSNDNGATTTTRNGAATTTVTSSAVAESHRNITGLQLPVTRNVSDHGRLALCQALEPEYHAYFRLLHQARNMHPHDMDECQGIAKKNCPNLDIAGIIDSIRRGQ